MTSKHNTVGFPAPALTMNVDVHLAAVQNGLLTALTDHSGSSDPSSGAPVAWGADEVGRRWLDTIDAANPVLKRWQQLEAVGPVYGWRTLRLTKTKYLAAPQAVTFGTASPAAADVAWEDVDLTTLLDGAGVQDASEVESTVLAVLIQLRIALGASETPGTTGADKGYLAVRQKGSTQDIRVQGKVADVYEYGYAWLALDSVEAFQFLVKVGGGTPNFRYAAWVLAIQEAL